MWVSQVLYIIIATRTAGWPFHRQASVENYRVIRQNLDDGKCQLEPTDTVEMNPSHPCAVDPLEPVHRVVNSRDFNQRAVSLHVYSRPLTPASFIQRSRHCGVIKLHYNTEYGKAKTTVTH